MNKDNYIIREATFDEIKIVQGLTQELLENDKSVSKNEIIAKESWALSTDGYDNYLEIYTEKDEYLYVVECDSKIVGYMACWVNDLQKWDAFKTFEIGNLYIKNEYRNRGIGTSLINKAKEICKENGIGHIKLNVLVDNEQALRFYEKNGLYRFAVTMLSKID